MKISAQMAAGLPAGDKFQPLPFSKRTSIERWLRGWREATLLRRSDAAIVSYAKSGRTWLRLMLSRFYQQRYGLPEGAFLEYDNLHRMVAEIPSLFFTHGNYLRDYTGHVDSVVDDFCDRPVVLLVRDPRDVAVSQYFQWLHRMRPHKKRLNAYPKHGSTLGIWEFVAEHEAGLDRVIDFLNLWAAACEKLEDVEVIRYEQMRAEPANALCRVLECLGTVPDDEGIRDAVEYAAFENMRKLEEQGSVKASGRRLVPGRLGNRESYKVRRAKVGGWRDYFDDGQIAVIDARVEATLSPGFGYRQDEGPREDEAGGIS
jgi:ribosome modulation factor